MSTRREFIKNVTVGTAAVSAASIGGVLSSFSAKSYKNIVGANDKIRMGAIGVNSRGNALAEGFAKEKGCEIAYVCDVDSRAMEKCIANVAKIGGNIPKGEKDIRRLLEKKDLDAVIIATPEHWHAPGALMAMKAGKHVYLEKPTAHSPAENEMLIEAVKKYKIIGATGMQRRSWPNVINAIKEINDGVIGRVYFGKAWYSANRTSIGYGKVVPVPEWLDWELWQGPAPRVNEYKDNYLHYNWHWFSKWGTGESGNNAVHFIDILRWGMNVDFPTAVSSMGGRYRYDDDWQFPDTQIINLSFGSEKMISWEGRSCNGKTSEESGVGATFYGESGSLVVTGWNAYKIYDLDDNLVKNVPSSIESLPGDIRNPSQKLDAFHFSNFLDGIRQGTPLYADIREGAISTTLALLGNISLNAKSTLSIDPSNGHIIKNKTAKKLWSREYERGWEMRL